MTTSHSIAIRGLAPNIGASLNKHSAKYIYSANASARSFSLHFVFVFVYDRMILILKSYSRAQGSVWAFISPLRVESARGTHGNGFFVLSHIHLCFCPARGYEWSRRRYASRPLSRELATRSKFEHGKLSTWATFQSRSSISRAERNWLVLPEEGPRKCPADGKERSSAS